VAEHHLPHRGHTGGIGDLLGLDEFVDRLAVHGRAREHQFAARERGRVRDAPGIDVEHGHHGQHRVARRQAHHVGQRSGVGMQRGRAVAVQRRLGVARGAAGVAHARCRVLIELGPGVVGRVGTDPGLVARQAGDAGIRRQFVGVAQRHPLLDGRALGMHGLHQGQKVQVKAQHLVFGVVGDPGDLLGVQARVDGVQHAARAAHTEVHLHVAVAVPGQRGHAVAELQAQPVERIGQAACALAQVLVGVAVDVALHAPRDDFGVAMVAFCELDQRRDQQGLALHQAQHVCSLDIVVKWAIIVTRAGLLRGLRSAPFGCVPCAFPGCAVCGVGRLAPTPVAHPTKAKGLP